MRIHWSPVCVCVCVYVCGAHKAPQVSCFSVFQSALGALKLPGEAVAPRLWKPQELELAESLAPPGRWTLAPRRT